jgi:hypothetical protein
VETESEGISHQVFT